ncbi:MAG TPA: hypothetical protein VMG41_03055 [Gemmatimonadales bacterium]|nr:hypothetical protein [Gemmatimonadales bacterium]
MRMRPTLAFFLLLIGFPLAAAAQGDIRLGLGGGLTLPLRADADLVKKGWMGMANLAYFPGASASLGFRLDALYARNVFKVTDGHRTELGGLGNLVFQFGARRTPNRLYVFGGGGYVRTQETGASFGTVTSTDPALDAGAGCSFGVRAFALFVEARYLNVYTSGTKPQFLALTGGISFGGL